MEACPSFTDFYSWGGTHDTWCGKCLPTPNREPERGGSQSGQGDQGPTVHRGALASCPSRLAITFGEHAGELTLHISRLSSRALPSLQSTEHCKPVLFHLCDVQMVPETVTQGWTPRHPFCLLERIPGSEQIRKAQDNRGKRDEFGLLGAKMPGSLLKVPGV